jgi:hypothetical protein
MFCSSRRGVSTKRKNCSGKRWRPGFASSDRKIPAPWDLQSYLRQNTDREGRYAEAEKLAARLSKPEFATLGRIHGDTLFALRQLGKALAYEHRYAEASKLFRDVIEKENNSAEQGNRYRCGMPSRVWPRLPTAPMTRFSICAKPSIAGMTMPRA